jgi:hypothetical protein
LYVDRNINCIGFTFAITGKVIRCDVLLAERGYKNSQLLGFVGVGLPYALYQCCCGVGCAFFHWDVDLTDREWGEVRWVRTTV